MWWLIASALAVPPDKQVGDISVGTAQIERFVVSPDGRYIAGRDAKVNGENAWILDLEGWNVVTTTPAGCRVGGVAIRPIQLDTGATAAEVWMACADGTLRLQQLQDGVLYDVVDADSVPISISVDTGLADVWYSGENDILYALSFASGWGVLHSYDPYADVVDGESGYPVSLAQIDGYAEILEGTLNYQGTQLLISHGSDRMSVVTLTGGAMATDSGFFLLTPVDITPSYGGGVYGLDNSGLLAEYYWLSGSWQYLSGLTLNDIDPQAVVANFSTDGSDDWMVVFGDHVKVWTMENGGFPDSTPYWESGDLENLVHDGIAFDDYVFGGGIGGGLRIITARPWVDPLTITVTPSTAVTGDALDLSFAVDEDADYAVYLGGDRTGFGGVQLASGTAGALENIIVPITVDASDGWVEGNNYVYVVATDSTGLTGHARVTVVIDNPPSRPNVTPGDLGFAEERLILTFPGIADADLSTYQIYVSDTEFVAADYDTAGPTDKIHGVDYPLTVAGTPGAVVDQELYPLDNDVRYWVAVRATDAGGKESEMSQVVSAVPREAFNAAELSGEQGGAPCQTGGAGAGWFGVFAALVAATRRRRGAILVGVVVPGVAAAAPPEREHWWNAHDLSHQAGDFQLRYGVVNFDSPEINEVYDQSAKNVLQMEFGPQIARVVELDAGIGFLQELSTTVSGSSHSIEKTMLTAWPLTVDGMVRLQILDEQLLVPDFRAGLDYLVWNELDDNFAGGKDKIHGAKTGAHWAVGGGLLLDAFAPRRASLLEAQTGINDTYLRVEYRKQAIDDRTAPWGSGSGSGLVFTGTEFTVGLKLDF